MKKFLNLIVLTPVIFISCISLFGQHISSIAAVQNKDSSLELFIARDGNDGGIYHTWQDTIDGPWPNAWHTYPTQGHKPDNNEHALAAGKDSRGRILFCYISEGIIYSWVSQGLRSSLSTDDINYTFRYPTTDPKTGDLTNVQSRYNYVTIANNADRNIEIIALDEAGRAWSIKQIANDAQGKWKFARPKYIGSPIEYHGPKLKSISATKYADGKLALVALADDGTAYWSSQLVAQSPPKYKVPRNIQAGQWSGQWQSLRGHDLKEVEAAESRDHQLEVVALGGDNNVYLKYQSLGSNSWTEWGPMIYENPPSTTNLTGYASPIIFKRLANETLFLILHMDAGDTQYKGTFGKAVQLPNNGGWPNHVEYYHAPAIITDALGGYDPHLLACIPDPRGRIHFFASTSSGLYVEHYIDYSGSSTSANLAYQNHEHEIPSLPPSQ